MRQSKDPNYMKEYYQKNKEKYRINYQNNKEKIKERSRKNKLKRDFGLTITDYNNLVEAQDNCCAVCGRHLIELKRRLSVDHNHRTNQVRGLLCRQCNYNLGWYEQCKQQIENYLRNS